MKRHLRLGSISLALLLLTGLSPAVAAEAPASENIILANVAPPPDIEPPAAPDAPATPETSPAETPETPPAAPETSPDTPAAPDTPPAPEEAQAAADQSAPAGGSGSGMWFGIAALIAAVAIAVFWFLRRK